MNSAFPLIAMLLAGCMSTQQPIPIAPVVDQSAAKPCAQTSQFSFVCGTVKPEDLAHIPGTPWIVASGFAQGAGLKIIDSATRKADFWFTGTRDQVDRDPQYSDCATPPSPAIFTTRGISLRQTGPGLSQLLVVNHGGREAIEIFNIDASKAGTRPRLVWRGCLIMPDGHAANSVASYSDGTIIATVLTRPGTSITDFVLGKDTGGVYERKPGETAFRLLPGTQLRGNNGLETARDDSGFFVIAFGSREVVAYARADTAKPLWRAEAPDFMPDNIHWDGDRLLLAGMARDEPRCGGMRQIVNGVADAMLCHRGYTVAELHPENRRFSIIASGASDPIFNGVSAAIIMGRELWLGSYQADRVAIHRLP